MAEDGVATVIHGITGIPMESTIPREGTVAKVKDMYGRWTKEMAGRRGGRSGGGRTGGRNGGRGRIPACQEYSEEGSVHTEPEVSVQENKQTHDEEHDFTFESEVKADLAREFTEMMKASLPELLVEALRKVNEAGRSKPAADAPIIDAANAPLARGCNYKSFKVCDPSVLVGKKDAVATFDWVIHMEAAIRVTFLIFSIRISNSI
ncbi:hypothetical protein L1987_46344 [Smallanthus sonchifolius]|uniref:Uncharacterized protein n=1 Tax=Smallanthus sonchifolius TaxID=185202 RepID=A0ACB9FZD7_9ASTR|nr:hypothetical protein L1987_46344 [Smallanthus sonchifolius]